jgi:hypothetical protein
MVQKFAKKKKKNAMGRLRKEEDCEFETSRGYKVRPCLKKKGKKYSMVKEVLCQEGREGEERLMSATVKQRKTRVGECYLETRGGSPRPPPRG